MKPPLAVSTFIAGADEKLAPLDAYTKDINTLVSSMQNYENTLSNALANIASFAGIDLKSIKDILKKIKAGGFAFSLEDFLKAISQDHPNLLSLISSLDDLFKNKFSQLQSLFGSLDINIDGQWLKFKKRDIAFLQIINQMLSDYTAGSFESKIVDKSAEAGIASGLLRSSSTGYIPGTYTALTARLKEKDIIIEATVAAMPDVVKSGNIMLLSEIANSAYAREIYSRYPNLISGFIASLSLDPKVLSAMGSSGLARQTKLAELFQILVDSFTLFDPKWNKTDRDSVEILYLDTITSSSAYTFHVMAKAYNSSKTKTLNPPNPILDIDQDMPEYFEDEFYYNIVENFGKKTVQSELRRLLPTVNFKVDPSVSNYSAVPAIGAANP